MKLETPVCNFLYIINLHEELRTLILDSEERISSDASSNRKIQGIKICKEIFSKFQLVTSNQ